MQQYQLYTFTDDGSLKGSRNFSGANDEDALRTAQVIAGRDCAEVWQGIRCIGRPNSRYHVAGNGRGERAMSPASGQGRV